MGSTSRTDVWGSAPRGAESGFVRNVWRRQSHFASDTGATCANLIASFEKGLSSLPVNLVNLENVSKAYAANALLDGVALGVGEGERIGVVGSNGGGKTTLASIVAGTLDPDRGRVTHARGLRLGHLPQYDALDSPATVRQLLLAGWAEHEWAGDPRVRDVLDGLLGGLGLPLLPGGWDATPGTLSGGERRRLALARLLVSDHDLLVLDEPTNHLDIEAIDWLARHLDRRGCAMVVVTHDRYFLDSVCSRIWEVERGRVHRYEGGYSAYVLARAERERLEAVAEDRRRNLARKELAWLRRGPPARTSKPKFRVEEANALIAGEPPPRDTVELTRFAMARLGKTVLEFQDVTLQAGDLTVLDQVDWQLGPGDRVGVVGVNGSGKTSLLRLLAGETEPVGRPAEERGEAADGAADRDIREAGDEGSTARVTSGHVVRGKTIRPAYLSQDVAELDPDERVLEAVQAVRRTVRVGKREMSASQLAERFGFVGQRQWTPIGRLSGGERRRLQLLRLLMDEPNVLMLDEPTNDLDIDTLNELEDVLDGWPGSLVVVSHDRYFLERVTDHVVALLGDGTLSHLPGGVDEYLQRRRGSATGAAGRPVSDNGAAGRPASGGDGGRASGNGGRADGNGGRTDGAGARAHGDGGRAAGKSAAETRQAKKELTRLERRLDKLTEQESRLHEQLAAYASDFEKLTKLNGELRELTAEKERVEEEWLELADAVT